MRHDKPDRNTRRIVEELRALGYIVIYAVGLPFDLIVIGYNSRLNAHACVFVEVKVEANPVFTKRELLFQQMLRSHNIDNMYCLARTTEDVVQMF